MIFWPRLGQIVRLHYRKAGRSACTDRRKVTYHGRVGVVVRAARGRGPRNVEVLFREGGRVTVPRGNLVALRDGVRKPPESHWLF